MHGQLLELKTQLIADVASMNRSVFVALVTVTFAQTTLIACALVFV